MVSFDIQSLFSCLPVRECIEIISRKLKDKNIPSEYTELLKHCLTSGYMLWNDQFYKQVDGVAMGSPVSPVVADIFMEDFEEIALQTAPIIPRFYKRYVDDTFTILPKDKVTLFLNHLNAINSKIQFTMELETNNSLAFLDVLVIRNPDNTLGHTVYRKPTHTDRYLNGNSHHHPTQLNTVGKSLVQRAQGICDQQHLDSEIRYVKQVLHNNKLRMPRLNHKNRVKPITVERVPVVLPYVKGVTDKIGHILKHASIKTFYKPPKKISQFLPPVKCYIPLQDAGVYKIDCDCGLSYIGQTKRSIKTRIREHIADVKHRRNNKSAVCDHILDNTRHYIRFDKAQILAKENRFHPRMIREAIEIKKHPNFNREEGWVLPAAWDPVVNKLKSKSEREQLQDSVSTFCVNRTN